MSFHINAAKKDVSETVLLAGDPMRAKWMAEKYLTDVFCYNKVRGMFGFTGDYKGFRVSIQGSGMGLPSTSIYVHELLHSYQVKTLIRVGTTGSLLEEIKIGETIIAMSANTDSSMNKLTFGGMDFAPTASYPLLRKADDIAQKLKISRHIGGIFSTDRFYNGSPDRYKVWSEHGVIGVEMESTALYTAAAKAGAQALTLLTVSDNLITGEVATAEDREKNVENVAKLALETALHESD